MNKKIQSYFFILIVFLALTILASTTVPYPKFCQSTVNGQTPSSQSGTTYVQDTDQYVQLSSTQILLDMRSQIQSAGNVAYSYYLQAGTTYYYLRLAKAGTDGQPVIMLTITTTIPISTSATDALAMFLGGESGVVALEESSGVIRLYQLSLTTLTLGGSHTLSPATQTFVKIITGGGQSGSPLYYFLTKDPANNKAYLYKNTNSFSTSWASITMANGENFIFVCPTGFLEIDSSPINSGPKIYKTGSGGTVTSSSISGTAPTFVTTTGINRNYDIIVFDFDNKFFVAMYDESYFSSTMFQIYTVSSSPTYGAVFDTAGVSGQTLSYQTDYTANFLQLSTDGSGNIKTINLYFADSYTSASQHSYKYSTPSGTPTGDDANILADLALGSLTNLKISFSFVVSGENSYYNVFILKVGSSSTSIVRYRTSPSGSSSSSINTLASQALAKDYQMFLSTDTQSLFHSTIGNVQVMTFEISCTCTVTTISQFICFGASLECTVAIQNLSVDCTIPGAGVDSSLTVGNH